MTEKIPIGISSCLLGEKVRFDGGHKNNSYIVRTLSEYFQFTSFCPEVTIGLGIPREPIRLVRASDNAPVRCVGTKNAELDVTEKLENCARDQVHWVDNIAGYIFKSNSPSCGMERVKLFKNGHPQRTGVGIFAKGIIDAFPCLPVEEEGRLGDARLRENFIQRVFIYARWKALLETDLTVTAFMNFHAQHKLIYMSHNQSKTRQLGQLVSKIKEYSFDDFARLYIEKATEILKIPTTRKNHTNVLEHIRGYLKRYINKEDKQELSETIELYRTGFLPLIVPITLLRHHFRNQPNEYIANSFYMQPHPKELMLLNSL